MKNLKTALGILICVVSFNMHAQEMETTETKPKEVFTSQERDSLQFWFYDRATVMGVKGEQREEFYNIVLYHSYKMKNLAKPSKGYTSQELKVKVEEVLEKQHAEVRALLDEEQYRYYLNTMNKIMAEVFKRRGWEVLEEK